MVTGAATLLSSSADDGEDPSVAVVPLNKDGARPLPRAEPRGRDEGGGCFGGARPTDAGGALLPAIGGTSSVGDGVTTITGESVDDRVDAVDEVEDARRGGRADGNGGGDVGNTGGLDEGTGGGALVGTTGGSGSDGVSTTAAGAGVTTSATATGAATTGATGGGKDGSVGGKAGGSDGRAGGAAAGVATGITAGLLGAATGITSGDFGGNGVMM